MVRRTKRNQSELLRDQYRVALLFRANNQLVLRFTMQGIFLA